MRPREYNYACPYPFSRKRHKNRGKPWARSCAGIHTTDMAVSNAQQSYYASQVGDHVAAVDAASDSALNFTIAVGTGYETLGDAKTRLTANQDKRVVARLLNPKRFWADQRGSVRLPKQLEFAFMDDSVQVRTDVVPDFPVYDGPTHGALVLPDGRVLERFVSGKQIPGYKFPSTKHVEGKAAIWMRENGVTDAVLYHNNPNGTCNWCHPQITTLLPEGTTMKVVPPAGTVIPTAKWYVQSAPYVGNSQVPKTHSHSIK